MLRYVTALIPSHLYLDQSFGCDLGDKLVIKHMALEACDAQRRKVRDHHNIM